MNRSEFEAKLTEVNEALGWDSYRPEWKNWTLVIRRYSQNGKVNGGTMEFQFPHETERFEKRMTSLLSHAKAYAKRLRAEALHPEERRTEAVSLKLSPKVFAWLNEQADEVGDTRGGRAASLIEELYKLKHAEG